MFGTTVGLELDLLPVVLKGGFEMRLRVICSKVGLELGLLLLCYREGLICDLWCLVLRWNCNWAYCYCVIGRV